MLCFVSILFSLPRGAQSAVWTPSLAVTPRLIHVRRMKMGPGAIPPGTSPRTVPYHCVPSACTQTFREKHGHQGSATRPAPSFTLQTRCHPRAGALDSAPEVPHAPALLKGAPHNVCCMESQPLATPTTPRRAMHMWPHPSVNQCPSTCPTRPIVVLPSYLTNEKCVSFVCSAILHKHLHAGIPSTAERFPTRHKLSEQ